MPINASLFSTATAVTVESEGPLGESKLKETRAHADATDDAHDVVRKGSKLVHEKTPRITFYSC